MTLLGAGCGSKDVTGAQDLVDIRSSTPPEASEGTSAPDPTTTSSSTPSTTTTTSAPDPTTSTSTTTSTTTTSTSTSTTTSTTTTSTLPTPLPPAAPVIDISIRFDADGNDNENKNDEWVRFTNRGPEAIDLAGWTVADEGPHRYRFATLVLPPGGAVTLFTGCGTDTEIERFWCNSGSAVWNNGGDTVFLTDSAGAPVAQKSG